MLHGVRWEAELADGAGLLARPSHLAELYAAGDFAALEDVLERLRAFDKTAWRQWTGRYVAGTEEGWMDALGRAWRFVDVRMPDPVRVPAELVKMRREKARREQGRQTGARLVERDSRMLRLHEQGTPIGELAAAFGLRDRAVYLALERARERVPT